MKNQQGVGAFVVVVALTVASGIGLAAFSVATSKSKSPNKISLGSATQAPGASRDEQRKKDAAQLASNLFSQTSVYKATVPESSRGFAMFSQLGGQNQLTDPLTRSPYAYNQNQESMIVGQATFRLNATCDNKIAGSSGRGMIVGGSNSSVAVAIKLESSGYACESSL